MKKIILCSLLLSVLLLSSGSRLGFGTLLDSMTTAVVSITYEHHEIHDGDTFAVHVDNTCTNTGEMTVFAFNTPNTTKWSHLVASATATAAASFRIVEAPSIDVGAPGTEETGYKTPYNRNRNSLNISTLSNIHSTPVVNRISYFEEAAAATANITTTTAVWTETIGSAGNPATKSGGGSRGQSEFILKQNTQYAVIVTSLDDNDNVHHITLEWYEHTNR